MSELLRAFITPFREPLQQWHPWIIHFPIALLVLDVVFTALFWITRHSDFAPWSRRCLSFALLTMVLAMLAGIHDSGLDLGEGNQFWLGLQDRWQNALVLRSGVSVHVLLALTLLAFTFARWLWRTRAAGALQGRQAAFYGIALLLNIWLLIAASHAGAVLNHN